MARLTSVSLAHYIKPNSKGNKVFNWFALANQTSQRFWISLISEDQIEIDFQGLDILGSDGMTWVMSIILYRRKMGKQTLLKLPDKDNQIAYLKFLKFDILSELLEFEITNPIRFSVTQEYSSSNPLLNDLRGIPYIGFSDWRKRSDSLIHSAQEYLIQRYKIPRHGEIRYEKLEAFLQILSELMINIFLHAGGRNGNGEGFATLIPPPGRFPVIRYCFSDPGLGFRESMNLKRDLSKYSKSIKTDTDGILAGLVYRALYKEEKVFGLFQALQFIASKKGRINIISGDSQVSIDLSGEKIRRELLDINQSLPVDWFSWIKTNAYTKKHYPVPGSHIYIEMKVEEL